MYTPIHSMAWNNQPLVKVVSDIEMAQVVFISEFTWGSSEDDMEEEEDGEGFWIYF